MDANLVRRVGFAVLAIPAALLLVWYGGWPLVLLLALVGVLGTRELFDLARRQRIEPAMELGLLTVLVFAPIAYVALTAMYESWWVLAAGLYAGAAWLVLLTFWAVWRRPPAQQPLASVAVTVFGVLYAGLLPAFLLILRHSGYRLRSLPGAALVVFPLAVVWICDTAAMFGGRILGGRKLAPVVSPGKTWSGTLVGVGAGLIVAPLYQALVFRPLGMEFALWKLLLCAGLWATLGQMGDLAESLFKRAAGVKDSSTLIPGHGGVLDRLDSLYVVIPLAALLYRVLGIR